MTTNNKRIYVDMDDVICTTTESFTELAQREFGRTVPYDEITTFNLQHSFQLTDREYTHFFRLIHEPEILMEFKPIESAICTLDQWSNRGYHIAVVTGRPASTRDTSLKWLNRHGVSFHSLTMVDKYNRENSDSGTALSLEALARKQYSLAVEDSWDMALFLSQTMETPVALLDRPWNRREAQLPNIHRIHGWQEIDMLIP